MNISDGNLPLLGSMAYLSVNYKLQDFSLKSLEHSIISEHSGIDFRSTEGVNLLAQSYDGNSYTQVDCQSFFIDKVTELMLEVKLTAQSLAASKKN